MLLKSPHVILGSFNIKAKASLLEGLNSYGNHKNVLHYISVRYIAELILDLVF